MITYYQYNPYTTTLSSTGTVTGNPSSEDNLNLILNATHTGNGVLIGAGATNNIIHAVSNAVNGAPYSDNNTNPYDGNLIEIADTLLGTSVNWTGGTPVAPTASGPGLTPANTQLTASAGGATPFNAQTGGVGAALKLAAGPGGANTNASSSAMNAGGAGGSLTSTAGSGGAGGTGGVGGAGGGITLVGGSGGSGSPGTTNANGGSVTMQPGAPGTGGTGGTPGRVLVQPLSDSASAFVAENAAASSTVLDVGTSNHRVGILTAAPAATLDVAGKFQVNGAGVVTAYNGNPTVGAGTPPVVGVTNVTASTSSSLRNIVSSTPAAGEYVIQYYADPNVDLCTTVGSGGVTFAFAWVDASGTTRTFTTPVMVLVTTGTQGPSNYVQGSLPVWAGSGTAITVTPGFTQCSVGAGNYDLHVAALQVQ